jgi:hypothetical protein
MSSASLLLSGHSRIQIATSWSCNRPESRRASCLQTLPALLTLFLVAPGVERHLTSYCWDSTARLNSGQPLIKSVRWDPRANTPSQHNRIVGLNRLLPCSSSYDSSLYRGRVVNIPWCCCDCPANGIGVWSCLSSHQVGSKCSLQSSRRKAAGPATHHSSHCFLFPIVPGLFFLHPGEISAPASVPLIPRVSSPLGYF